MPKYRVEINAENLLVEMEGRTAKYGFFTFRCVEAESPDAAMDVAAELLQDDDSLSEMIQNADDDSPVINVGAITQVDDLSEEIQPGRIWYAMRPKRWWQFWRR